MTAPAAPAQVEEDSVTATYPYTPAHDPRKEPAWAGPLSACDTVRGPCPVRSELIDVVGALRQELQQALAREAHLRAQQQAQPGQQ